MITAEEARKLSETEDMIRDKRREEKYEEDMKKIEDWIRTCIRIKVKENKSVRQCEIRFVDHGDTQANELIYDSVVIGKIQDTLKENGFLITNKTIPSFKFNEFGSVCAVGSMIISW